jgi:hypothetical protein
MVPKITRDLEVVSKKKKKLLFLFGSNSNIPRIKRYYQFKFKILPKGEKEGEREGERERERERESERERVRERE